MPLSRKREDRRTRTCGTFGRRKHIRVRREVWSAMCSVLPTDRRSPPWPRPHHHHPQGPRTAVAARADLRRGRAAHRDRRRRPAARRRGHRADLGEHPRAAATATRASATSTSAPRPSDSTSPSRTGPPTDCSPSSSSSPASSSSASSSPAICATRRPPRCPSSPPSAAWPYRRSSTSLTNAHRRRLAGRLGRAHRHRHRLRARRPRGHRHLAAERAARLPAHARRRRRPLRDPDHRGLLHRRASTSPRSAAPSSASPSSGCCCGRAYAAGTSTSRSPWSSGG